MEKQFILDQIHTADHLYLLYSRVTRHPFCTYDAEKKSDRFSVYTDYADAEAGKADLERYGYPLMIADIPVENRQKCFVDAHALGVTEVLFCRKGEKEAVVLDEIEKLDLSHIPPKQRPLLNPALQLTSIYFLQEHYREVEDAQLTDVDRQVRMELDDEFAHNLANAQYMVPLCMKRGNTMQGGTRIAADNFEWVYAQDSNKDVWVPIFSDVTEFELFNAENNLSATLLTLDQILKVAGKERKGAILNPRCQAYKIMNRAMEIILANFKEEK